MISKRHFKKISPVLWEIPKDFRSDMRVPGRVYATEKMLEDIITDRSLEQLVNVATLPGIQKHALAMPDAHEGYGFCIGGVAAMKYPDGVISPGGIGYDINCGVRLLRSQQTRDSIKPFLENLSWKLYNAVPSGVGRGGQMHLSNQELDHILKDGVRWLLKKGFATEDDIECIESNGSLGDVDPAAVSDHAKKRGRDQLGTLGAGNHFVEVDYVDEICDEQAARAFGLFRDQIVVLIHTGSRGLGHQVATDYIRIMMRAMLKYGIHLPDRELACVPFSSKEGGQYFTAMAAAANFAWSNRQMITHQIREAWGEVLSQSRQVGRAADRGGELELLYDVAHNMAKIEEHEVAATAGVEMPGRAGLGPPGKIQKMIVHRKGATRAFGPGHPEVPERYRAVGQPVLIPGSMGTASYVLAGTAQAMRESFGSSCHGAGRRMSRHQAKRQVHGATLRDELEKKGILIRAGSMAGLAEEAPVAYKDIEDVVDVVAHAGIAKKVARLRPLIVVKG